MPRLSQRLLLEDLEDGTYKLKVAREFVYYDPKLNLTITTPEGYISDGASIPRFAWRIIGGPWGPYRSAAIPHDDLYSNGDGRHPEVTKEQADLIFLHRMEELGIGKIKRMLMYRAVRLNFRGGHWNKKD